MISLYLEGKPDNAGLVLIEPVAMTYVVAVGSAEAASAGMTVRFARSTPLKVTQVEVAPSIFTR